MTITTRRKPHRLSHLAHLLILGAAIVAALISRLAFDASWLEFGYLFAAIAVIAFPVWAWLAWTEVARKRAKSRT